MLETSTANAARESVNIMMMTWTTMITANALQTPTGYRRNESGDNSHTCLVQSATARFGDNVLMGRDDRCGTR